MTTEKETAAISHYTSDNTTSGKISKVAGCNAEGRKRRRGCIYSEMTNKGRRSMRFVRGAKPVYCFRWVGEIVVYGKRYRFRSTNYANVMFWLDCMVSKYGYF